RVRVADLQAADRWLEAPAPDVVRVGVPEDANRRGHASVSARVSGGLLSSPRFRGVGTLMVPDSRRWAMRLDDRQWAGLLLFVGIAQFAIIGLTVAESVYPGYSVSINYISDLGVGPAALIFDPSIILLGLLSYAALGLYISKIYLGLGPGGMERMIVWPVLVWGLAFGGYLFASSPSASGTSDTP